MFEFLWSQAETLLYPALAFIAFLDTLIGIGFFVFGEVAFVTAGVTFARSGDLGIIALVLVAGWAGDITSFLLGRSFGSQVTHRFLRPVKRRRQWRRARGLLARHGLGFVIVSRLLGPVAWITPFLAGTLGMSPLRFALASFPAVMIGGGQFILLGYLGKSAVSHWPLGLHFLTQHFGLVLLCCAICLGGAATWFVSGGGRLRRFLCSALTALLIFVATNLYYFFGSDAHAASAAKTATALEISGICEVVNTELVAVPGDTELHLPQPINVMLVSATPPEQLMTDLGWQKNLTFSQDRVGLHTYAKLLWKQQPPVSELYFNGTPAKSAFQLPGTLAQRVHIRWWTLGQHNGLPVYLGAISRDEELAIKYYRAIPALLHDIDPEVDKARDLLMKQAQLGSKVQVQGLIPFQQPVPDGVESDYQTDGRILVLSDTKLLGAPGEQTCLGWSSDGEA